jgi:putative DNA primase/helicase
LSITGRGYLPVNRKNKTQLTTQLPCRIMVMSNDLMEWPDAAGALPQRTLIVAYTRSFLGNEDPALRERFRPELPGILNWALDGAARLDEAGTFTQSAASSEAHQEAMDSANDVIPFVRDYCQLGDDHSVRTGDLYQSYALAHGGFRDDARQQMRFGRNLKKAFPQVTKDETWERQPDGSRRKVKYYRGITLSNFLPDFARPQS